MNFRRFARLLQVSHVSVMNWVIAHADQLPAPPTPAEKPLQIIEMDERGTASRFGVLAAAFPMFFLAVMTRSIEQ